MSLDIANAFNSLPWASVEEGMRHFGFPPYLVHIVRDYFRDRILEFRDKAELQRGRAVCRGVPQGSVIGPLLWNIGYDQVLRTALPPGCSVVCYADDTLVLAGGRDWKQAKLLGQLALDQVVHSIRRLGLEVAPEKTEAMFFHSGLGRAPPRYRLRIGGTHVRVGTEMKYLGLTLDGTWGFQGHFEALAPKLGRTAGALSALMPNVGGPGRGARRLYANVVHSVALYGSPVWANELAGSRRAQQMVRRGHRAVATRLARAYRTTSYMAATALAGTPPMELLALMYSEMYRRARELRRGEHNEELAGAMALAWTQARQRLLLRWKLQLGEATGRSGKRVADAIRPCLDEWMGRVHGDLTFRTTQVLTGHGCFGEYLHRVVRKEETTRCHHCDAEEDTAQHTLEDCPAWAEQRRVLVDVVGADLSPPALVRAMLGGREAWSAVSSFCDDVMSRKEEAEQRRRGELAHPRRRPPPAHRRVAAQLRRAQGAGTAPPRRARVVPSPGAIARPRAQAAVGPPPQRRATAAERRRRREAAARAVIEARRRRLQSLRPRPPPLRMQSGGGRGRRGGEGQAPMAPPPASCGGGAAAPPFSPGDRGS